MATSKSTKSPAFQFYPDAFLSSTKVIAMSMTERGVYITLMCAYWLDGGLPNDLAALARIVGMKPQQFSRMWSHNLSRCFVVRGDRLVQARLETERKKQRDYRERQRNAAASRWDKPADAVAIPPQTSLTPSLSPSPSPVIHTQRGPIHSSHKAHAHCGRVCVPGDLHSQFVRARNHDGADTEMRDWYLLVDNEWSTGAKATANTGGNDYRFWRARFDEKWPDESAAVKPTGTDRRTPAWGR